MLGRAKQERIEMGPLASMKFSRDNVRGKTAIIRIRMIDRWRATFKNCERISRGKFPSLFLHNFVLSPLWGLSYEKFQLFV